MKQLILVGNQKVKFQDTETTISLTLVSDGNTVTIDSTKTYSVKIKNGTGYVKAINATPDTTNNMVTFSTSGFDGLPVDAYFLELWVIDTNGQTIYPSDSFIELDITANATGVQGQVVPAITLQEFEDRFSTLQSDLEAKVGTLIGPTGATGNGISGVSTQYQLGTDGVNVPTGTWRDTPSTPTDTLPYMWTRNVTTYTDGSTHTSYNISAKGTKGNNFTIQGSTSSIAGLPSTGTDGEGYMVGTELYVWTNGKWNDIVNMKGVQGDQGIQGIQGIKGDTGNGIQSTSTDYQLSAQGVEVPNTGWSTTIPVTTNALPYLWTRVTITFTDGSQHVIYFTSNKGDKGDKGDTGEKGDTGANLAVKGALDKSTSLPSTGNSEGDAYLVGTDLYVYTNGAWKDCGPIVAENTVLYNADGSLNVNGTNFNYVQDLRNGKIQYNDGTNNVQVTPMDANKEASDILAARTYTDTSVSALSNSVDTKLSSKANTSDLSTGLATKADDSKVVHTADMRKPASDVAGIEEVNALQTQVNNSAVGTNLILGTSGPFTMWYGALNTVWNVDKKRSEISLPSASSPTEVLPKDPSFFLNVTPGIPYTQSIYVSTDAPLTGKAMQVSWFTTTYGHNTKGKDNISSTSKNVYRITSTQTWPASSTDGNIRAFDLLNLGVVFDFTKGTFLYFYQPKFELGSHATDWCPNPEDKQDKIGYTPADDSKVSHNSGDETIGGTKTFTNPIKGTIDGITYRYSAVGDDLDTSYMNDTVIYTGVNKVAHAPAGTSGTWAIVRNYNSDTTNGAQSYYDTNTGVLYVRTRNSNTTYTQWIKVADDSKVAHLSGANNFDTIPTVNNNPLLLSSSLPSTLADTTKLSNFTAGLQSNGTPVATSTDLSTGLATKADTSAIDPSVLVKKTLTATDDVLALDPGTYLVWGTAPKNYPTKLPWGRVTVKMLGPDGVSADTKSVEVFDTSNNHWINIHAGYPLVWSGWEVPNSGTMASKSDVTTAISTATANSADVSKANTFSKQQTFSTNPTNGSTNVSQLWKFTADGLVNGVAVDTSGNVYAGTYGGNSVYKLNSTGTQVWKFTADNVVHSVAVDTSGNVYAGTNGPSVYKLDSTGNQVWKFTADNVVYGVTVDTSGNVYAGTTGNSVYKLNNTGSQVWKFTADNTVYSVAVDTSGNVYAGTVGSSVYKINSTGTQVWKFTADGIVMMLVVDTSGNVYAGTGGNSVYKLDSTGNQVWKFIADNIVYGVTVDTSGNVYAGTKGNSVYKIDSTGSQVWKFTADNTVYSVAVDTSGNVYTGTGGSSVYKLNSTLQVYPIYTTTATEDTATLIASLQSSGYSGLVGVPMS